MKTIYTHATENGSTVTSVIEIKDIKFKIVGELRNGRSSITADIMKADGSFEFVFGTTSIDFKFIESYVSDASRKIADIKRGMKIMEKLLAKIYS